MQLPGNLLNAQLLRRPHVRTQLLAAAARLGNWGEAATEAGKDLLKKAPWIGAAYAVARKYMP